VDQLQFLLAVAAAFVVVAAPIVISIIVMSREASIELPMPLLFNDPEPKRGIAEGDLDPWRIELVRPRRPAVSTPRSPDRSERGATGSCELAPAR
jgi:hypothetical protein